MPTVFYQDITKLLSALVVLLALTLYAPVHVTPFIWCLSIVEFSSYLPQIGAHVMKNVVRVSKEKVRKTR